MKRRKKPDIVIDADVIIHFFEGEYALLLGRILKDYNILVPDIVLSELFKNSLTRRMYEVIMSAGFITEVTLDDDEEAYKIYLQLLKQNKGRGESSCMALCKANGITLASSNLTDTKKYCLENGITYLTTMDVLLVAYESGVLGEPECDYFIYNVKSKGSILIHGIDSIVEYQRRKRAGLI